MNDIVELPATTGAAQSLVGQLVKAEIDQQIATAHQYPRSVTKVNRNVLSLVTMSQAAAAECGYALPRGDKPILGPSIRLAEIVASQWGNCRIGARVVHVDRFEKYVEAEGVFHDLETNTATTARVRRRIVDRQGRIFNDDMIVVTGNAACSIAKRNAILAGVPKAVWNGGYEAALHLLKGDVKTLPERRGEAFKQFAAFGVKPELIFAALEVEGEADIGMDQLVTLGAMLKAIREGEETVEGYFPNLGRKVDPAAEGQKGSAAKLADVAGSGKGKGDAGAARGATADQAKGEEGKDKAKAPDKDKAKDKSADQGEKAKGEADAKGKAEGEGKADAKAPDGADKPQEGGTASGDPEDEEAAAYTRGRKAFGRGMKADACPPDIKRNEKLADAWMEGWKGARDEEDAK